VLLLLLLLALLAPLLLLLDTNLQLEGVEVASVAAGPLLGQSSRARDVQQSVNYLHTLPSVLQPLLLRMVDAATLPAQGVEGEVNKHRDGNVS